jgi:maleate isomerase
MPPKWWSSWGNLVGGHSSVASPAAIYEWVRSHVPSSAQAVFIGGNSLRAIGVIAGLEEDLRRPVLTANQVSLWYALRVAGAEVRVDNYGQWRHDRLF